MIILGVDPGTIFTGYGVVRFDNNKLTHIANGIIKLPSNSELPNKLKIIYTELEKIIKSHKPDEFAIETAFYGKNIQSALKIGYARGVSLLAAVNNKIPIGEYSPAEVKKAVVGKGRATKEQVAFMIKVILELKKLKMKPDESDALAIAVCHAFKLKSPASKKSKNWKSFVESFPERIIE